MSKPREELVDFADFMEDILRESGWKGGWNGMSIEQLIVRAKKELSNIERVICFLSIPVEERVKLVQRQCADVANFMMMIFDVVKRTE